MDSTLPIQLTAISIGLLMLRLVVGLAMAAHGSQKLFGWFGGHGLAGTGGFFEMLGFKPGRLFALAAGATEVLSGILVEERSMMLDALTVGGWTLLGEDEEGAWWSARIARR